MRAVLINPAPHGNGPYLVSLRFAYELDKQLGESSIKIVPGFGSAQRRILGEEFGGREDIFLDSDFGNLLKNLTFTGDNYGDRLRLILDEQGAIEREVKRHFFGDGKFIATNLITREEKEFNVEDISLEISHNNIVSTGLEYYGPSFLTTIAPFSSLVRASWKAIKRGELKTDYLLGEDDFERLEEIGLNLEKRLLGILTCTPSTLDHLGDRGFSWNEELIPPFIQISHDGEELDERGVYVIRSGIGKKTVEELEGILEVFRGRGYDIYSPFPEEGETRASLGRIANPGIEYVIGRMGLSTVYLATQHGKVLVTFPFQRWDDWEIWHNEQTFCNLDKPFVLKYEGDEGFLDRADEVRQNIEEMNLSLEEKFGTRDGIAYGANKMAGYLK